MASRRKSPQASRSAELPLHEKQNAWGSAQGEGFLAFGRVLMAVIPTS